MNPQVNEVDKFFEALPQDDKSDVADIFGDRASREQAPGKAVPVTPPAKEGATQDDGLEPRKNRRHRRLEDALEKERQANIEMNQRLMKVLEAKESPTGSASLEMPPEWIALYGDAEASKNAWRVQQKMLESYGTRIKEETLNTIREEEQTVNSQKKEFQTFIDEQFENLEDEYGVDLTSDSPAARKARYELLDTVERLSPKNQDGLITGYADFGAAFELYRGAKAADKQPAPTNDKAKALAAKSMQQSGQGGAQAQQTTPTPGFYGWRKDYNL